MATIPVIAKDKRYNIGYSAWPVVQKLLEQNARSIEDVEPEPEPAEPNNNGTASKNALALIVGEGIGIADIPASGGKVNANHVRAYMNTTAIE